MRFLLSARLFPACLTVIAALLTVYPALAVSAGDSAALSYADDTVTEVAGTIADAVTGEPLIAATVQIEGTYRGTITNADGDFVLPVGPFPSTLIIRYIGYETRRVELDTPPGDRLDIRMSPTTALLEEVVVTGEDPAVRIMREVIRRKPLWRNKLETYVAEAYTRQRLENDQGIVSITESESRVFWHRERGSREVLLAREQTSNMEVDQNFAAATLVPNFYDDDIEISGFDMIGVTHPDALRYYYFELDGIRELDGQPVYDILVRPRRRLQPTFEGKIAVLGGVYALLEVDLRPGEAVMFPPPIQEFGLWYRQQFSNFGGDFWLPVDVRIQGNIKFGFPGLQFPPIAFHQLSRLTNYEVNIPLPDTLYSVTARLLDAAFLPETYDSTRSLIRQIPLEDQEQEAYAGLDSTDTLDKAFEPTGALARFVRDEENERESRMPGFLGDLLTGFSPRVGYNRVDAAQLGVNYTRRLHDRFRITVDAAYYTGPGDLAYGGGIRYMIPMQAGTLPSGRPRQRPLRMEAGYSYETRHLFQESRIHPMMSAGFMLLGGDDYFDWHRAESGYLSVSRRLRNGSFRWTLSANTQTFTSLDRTTSYSIPGGIVQRENPASDEGINRFAEFSLTYGDDVTPFGITGSQAASIAIRQSASAWHSTWDYTRVSARLDWQFETFYTRRLFSNTLDVRLEGGFLLGDQPVHQLFGSDNRLSYFTPFGVLRTQEPIPVMRNASAALFWEHNFRTIPFEAINFGYAVEKNWSLIIFGAHRMAGEGAGMGSVPGPVLYHHEAGISLNGLFGILRADVALRLDQPGIYAGVSVARIF